MAELKPRKPRARLTAAQRATRDKRRAQKHAAHIKFEYGITPEEYAAIKEAQGGVCYICQRATGATKKLAVDHDHALEKKLLARGWDAKAARRRSVRGLLCYSCNRMLAHARDAVLFFSRCIDYLTWPPADDVLQDYSGGYDPGVTETVEEILAVAPEFITGVERDANET